MAETKDKKPTFADVCKKWDSSSFKQPPKHVESKIVKKLIPIKRQSRKAPPRTNIREEEIERSLNEGICCFRRECLCHECDFMHAQGETFKEWQERMQWKLKHAEDEDENV